MISLISSAPVWVGCVAINDSFNLGASIFERRNQFELLNMLKLG